MSQFTFNLELNHKPNEDDTHNIIIRITNNKKHKRFSTEFNIKKSHWIKNGRLRQTVKDGVRGDLRASYINMTLSDIITREKVKIRDIINKGYEITKEDVKRSLEGENYEDFLKEDNETLTVGEKSKYQDFYKYADLWFNRFEENKKWGDRDVKKSSVNVLKKYHGKSKLLFAEINYDFLNNYRAYLRSQNLMESTVQKHLKVIRRFFNLAINEKVINHSLYPFRLFSIGTSKSGKKKKLTDKQRELIENYKCRPGRQQESLDFLILAFMFQGIRVGDLLTMKCKQISDTHVKYTSIKRDKDMGAKIYDKSLKIIRHYMRGPDDFLFSFMDDYKHLEYDSYEFYKAIKVKVQKINNQFKDICEELGIGRDVSTHVMRHSFADYARRITDNDIFSIKEMLGHESIKTTEIYIGELSQEEKDNVSDKLFS